MSEKEVINTLYEIQVNNDKGAWYTYLSNIHNKKEASDLLDQLKFKYPRYDFRIIKHLYEIEQEVRGDKDIELEKRYIYCNYCNNKIIENDTVYEYVIHDYPSEGLAQKLYFCGKECCEKEFNRRINKIDSSSHSYQNIRWIDDNL